MRKILTLFKPVFVYRNVRYRICSPESFSVAREVFSKKTYDNWIDQVHVETVVDLGCNIGYFTCYLGSRTAPSSIDGLLVDPNADVIEECRWHLAENGFTRCRTLCAAVGPDADECDLFVSDFNISSSVRSFESGYPFPLRQTETLRVPVVRLSELIDTFGDRRVNILKIDIEGSELELLEQNLECLRKVDWIVIEWHKWVLSYADVESRLNGSGFASIAVLKEDDVCGLGLFKNAGF